MGFGSISRFIDNGSDKISPFGELSVYSSTFVKDTGKYRSEDSPGYFLTTFKTQEKQTGEFQPLSTLQADLILNTVRACVAYTSSHSLPYDLDNFKMAIIAEYPNDVADLNFGPLVYHAGIALPQFIEYLSPALGMEVKVWLSDSAFRDQFTDSVITVVPVIDNINDFFLRYEEATEKVKAVSITQMTDRMQQAKKDSPDTVIKILEFDFYNRHNNEIKQKVMWGFLIYGQEGDNIDILKDKLAEYLIENSDYEEADWENIFPEIFQRTEFLLVPRWDQLATKNLKDLSSLYSQVIPLSDLTGFVEDFLGFYGGTAFVRNNTYAINFAWRYLGSTITNGLKNAPDKKDWKKMFPDYIPTGVGSDMGRMAVATQDWLYFINEVLRQAETATPVTQLPSGMRRVMRGEKLFISSPHKNVNYLVACKWNQQYS